ncbi:MAG TPA: peptide chain release factor-like protein [Candidatus Sumerlaeota bacterium]|nr:MAG: Peptide chain release factor 1 [candidate division BRC1 bacterium ADurb.Bin183]HOE62674.1 peptide chain release factor-like protein [Candidatus Sumerlaeota bacterium]HRR29980.1 peptide chain release factor-like protein [Candidatus Sumerlaeia bacterium]HON49434.1 peptide chain release factor-like protein [Candidatus Sumerlaeota bacterium]HOR64816.1 peptide chain release factor-like protein [Candidatus Sumerlaeota bacterium]
MIYHLPESDDVLLAECDVETFCSSGPGGQNVNRRETAVRLRHRPTGLVIVCQREREQHRNKQIALASLRRKLRMMLRRRRRRIPTKPPEVLKERVLESKKLRSLKKAIRRKPIIED